MLVGWRVGGGVSTTSVGVLLCQWMWARSQGLVLTPKVARVLV